MLERLRRRWFDARAVVCVCGSPAAAQTGGYSDVAGTNHAATIGALFARDVLDGT